MPFREAIGIGKQVAEALEAAHERRIVHRDLKPANIKLTRDSQVKVLDFGLAKAVRTAGAGDAIASRTVSASLTQAMTVVGTPAYMSPEQASGKNIDTRTDVWAFGCVFYEMLSGVRAFPGATVTEVLAAVLEREPDWSVLPAGMPPEAESLLRRCLRKDPRMRLRDIGDARIELEEILAGGHRRQVPSPEVWTTPKHLARLKYAVPAILCLVAVALGVMLYRGRLNHRAIRSLLPSRLQKANRLQDGRRSIAGRATTGVRFAKCGGEVVDLDSPVEGKSGLPASANRRCERHVLVS